MMPELYLGLLTAEMQRCLLLRVHKGSIRSFQPDRDMKGLKMEIITDTQQPDFVFLNLVLLNQHAPEIFDILIQDIINTISPFTEERKIFKSFVERVETWRILFEKTGPEALSPEEQQGLYGELYFLRKWIINNSEDQEHCVNAWSGVDKDLRDFQTGGYAIEVKTTRGNNHQKVHIHGERQLDVSRLKALWLYHLSLEVQQRNGESLNQLTDSILKLLKENILALTAFKSRLLRGGYFTSHRVFYENTGYQLRQEMFYAVKDDFPRIEESMVPRGVGDVSYSIILSDCTAYIVSESSIFETTKTEWQK